MSHPILYRGPYFTLQREEVALPNGHRFSLDVVRHPGGSAVVALDEAGQLCLVRQYRHVAGGWLWELPAGKRDGGEAPEITARRELAEEAGLVAGEWINLGLFYSSPGIFSEVIHLYLARDLTHTPRSPEQTEYMEVHWVPFSTALAWAIQGEIADAKTIIGLLRAKPLVDAEERA